MASLQGICYNGFRLSDLLCLQTKLPSFLTIDYYTGKYRAFVKDFQASENAALAVEIFL